MAVGALGRLANRTGHSPAGNGDRLAPEKLPTVLDLEGAKRQSGPTRRDQRGPRSDSQNEPRESDMGCSADSRRASEARHRHWRDQCEQVHGPPSEPAIPDLADLSRQPSQEPGLGRFLPRADHPVSDPVRVPGAGTRPAPDLHFGVTAHPTAEWTAQQLRNAFPWDTAARYLLRDRDGIFGDDFVQQVRDMGIEEVLSGPRSPWQRAYIERVIGSIRRECLDHMIVFNEASL